MQQLFHFSSPAAAAARLSNSSDAVARSVSASPGLTPPGKRQKNQSIAGMVNASDSDGSEDDGGDCEDVATLTPLPLLPADMPYAKWLIRVRNTAGVIGFLCRCCRALKRPGKWFTKPCYPNLSHNKSGKVSNVRKQPIIRHAESKAHRESYDNFFNSAEVMSDMISSSHSKATENSAPLTSKSRCW